MYGTCISLGIASRSSDSIQVYIRKNNREAHGVTAARYGDYGDPSSESSSYSTDTAKRVAVG